MSEDALIDWLSWRLQQPLPGKAAQWQMVSRATPDNGSTPRHARPSAVLLLLFPKQEQLHILLTERTADGSVHSGQLSFPGGKAEPSDADLRATALREANEEIGIRPEDVKILGALTPLYIPVSNYLVHPFVGYAQSALAYAPSPQEVQRVLETPITHFLNERHKTVIRLQLPIDSGLVRRVNAYVLPDDSILWGATAMILSELMAALQEWYQHPTLRP